MCNIYHLPMTTYIQCIFNDYEQLVFMKTAYKTGLFISLMDF